MTSLTKFTAALFICPLGTKYAGNANKIPPGVSRTLALFRGLFSAQIYINNVHSNHPSSSVRRWLLNFKLKQRIYKLQNGRRTRVSWFLHLTREKQEQKLKRNYFDFVLRYFDLNEAVEIFSHSDEHPSPARTFNNDNRFRITVPFKQCVVKTRKSSFLFLCLNEFLFRNKSKARFVPTSTFRHTGKASLPTKQFPQPFGHESRCNVTAYCSVRRLMVHSRDQ